VSEMKTTIRSAEKRTSTGNCNEPRSEGERAVTVTVGTTVCVLGTDLAAAGLLFCCCCGGWCCGDAQAGGGGAAAVAQ
jgi:hypothetical protein